MTEEKNTKVQKNEPKEMKVDIPLSHPLHIDDKEIKNLIIRNPKGRDMKGISLADIFNFNANAIALLMSRITENTFLDRQEIRDMPLKDHRQIVEAITLFVDGEISDIETHIIENGKQARAILPQPYSNHKELIFREIATGDLRGVNLTDLYNKNFSTICKVAPRLLVGQKLDSEDFEEMSLSNLIIISEAMLRSLESEDIASPKLIKG